MVWVTAKIVDWVVDRAYQPGYFGDLKVPVRAPQHYYQKGYREDKYSARIVWSKTGDQSWFFWDYIKKVYYEVCGEDSYDLICVIPSSTEGHYSPTMLELARRLSEETGIPNDNILVRRKRLETKMARLRDRESRCKNVKGTVGLIRPLQPHEKRILLLDDTKATGASILECATVLKRNGAAEFLAICLGVNA